MSSDGETMLKALQIAEMHDRFFAYCELKRDTSVFPNLFKLDLCAQEFFNKNHNLCVALGITTSNLIDMYLLRI